MKGKEKQQIAEFIILIMSVLGLIQFVGAGLIKTVMGIMGSFILLSISAFGVVWLMTLIKKGKFKDRETIYAIALIIAGVFLYKFIPTAFPATFTLMP